MHSVNDRIEIMAADTGALRSQCARWDYPVHFTLPDQYADGCYWQTILRSSSYQGHRTVFIRAGTLVPTYWDARLFAAMDGSDAIAVSPVSAQHELLTLFDAPQKLEIPVDDLDRWLTEYAEGESFDIPFILESCAALQGKAWVNLGTVTDVQLYQATYEQGLILLGTDQLFVDDSASSAVDGSYDIPESWVTALKESHPLTLARHALSELNARKERHSLTAIFLPAKLHISHSWGGGLGRWIEDAVEADSNYQTFVLRSLGDWGAFGKRIALYHNAEMGVPLKSWLLAKPILSTTSSHYQYQQIINEVISDYKIEEIAVSSLIGQSLDIFRTRLPTTLIRHDFYPFCPPLVATFNKPCRHCDNSQLEVCLSSNPYHRFFKMESNNHWKNIRSQFLSLVGQQNIHLVAPSQSVVNRYQSLATGLKEKSFNVIEHGLNQHLLNQLESVQKTPIRLNSDRLRIIVLGSLVKEKGGELLSKILPKLTSFADIHLIGSGASGQKYAKLRGVKFIESYDRDQLENILQKIQPEVGLLLSIVPETFSYTLSELWAAGIPVIATKVGAFSDRIEEGVNGWLVEPHSSDVLAKVKLISTCRADLERARSRLFELPHYSSKEMMTAYNQICILSELIPKERLSIAQRKSHKPKTLATHKYKGELISTDGCQEAYKKVLSRFIIYTGSKINSSPKTPKLLRAVLVRALKYIANHLIDGNIVKHKQK
ncbi:MAG: hypothetical protein DRR42_27080 [Gammaproteobacteria bacterium]|nr:MAG: hypothetical protein DRR42_27080 [Gammaproteobacteria bacterium]